MGSKITVDSDCSHKIKRYLLFGKAMTNLDSVLKRKDITLLIKVHIVKAMVFSGSHVPVWELDHKEIWVPKSWCFRTVVLKQAPVLWPPDAKSQLIRKDLVAGKDWRQEEKGSTEDEMVGWHHQCDGHEFEQALEDDEGQGSLACYSPWVSKSWTTLSNWIITKSLNSVGVLVIIRVLGFFFFKFSFPWIIHFLWCQILPF